MYLILETSSILCGLLLITKSAIQYVTAMVQGAYTSRTPRMGEFHANSLTQHLLLNFNIVVNDAIFNQVTEIP